MNNEIILFENQEIKLEVNMKDETVWLNTEQIASLFDRDYKTIRKHINNVFSEIRHAFFMALSLSTYINMHNINEMIAMYDIKANSIKKPPILCR